MAEIPTEHMDSSPSESFAASRWTQGNFLFPTRLVVSPQRVSRVKSRMFGSNEESMAMSKVASVHISTGVFWAEIRIESTGGSAVDDDGIGIVDRALARQRGQKLLLTVAGNAGDADDFTAGHRELDVHQIGAETIVRRKR